MLYVNSLTPSILIGVPPVNSCGTPVVTVTTCPGVAPSPEIILVTWRRSAEKAPTISYSGLCFANPPGVLGNFSSISLIDALL